MKNKKGWIRIVEAVVAVLLIVGVVLFVMNKGYLEKEDISTKVYKAQLSILREIEAEDNLRDDILAVEVSDLPVGWGAFEENGLIDVKNRILNRLPNYLSCEAKLCDMYDLCGFDNNDQKDIYAQSVGITATNEIYSPRQLKLFCWVEED